MKKIGVVILLILYATSFTACDFFGSNTEEVTTTAGTTENNTAATGTVTTDNSKMTTTNTTLTKISESTNESFLTTDIITESELATQLRSIYHLALEADAFDGTYEEWLETVQGPQGESGVDGQEIILSVVDNAFVWKYDGGEVWDELITFDELRGSDGVGVVSASINETGEIVMTYSDQTEENIGRIVTQYQVIFYDYNGYFIDSDIVEFEGSATPPANPEREGYTFIGWSETLDNITCDMDVFALYDVTTQPITIEDKKEIDYSQVYSVDDKAELVEIKQEDNITYYAYKVLHVENGILEQLTTWTSSNASNISFTTGRSTSESITRGLSTSLSTTFGVASDIFSASLAIEIEVSLEETVTEVESDSVTITYDLNEYIENQNYAVFLTGNFEIYQLFEVIDGEVTEETTIFKIIGTPITRLISSNTSYVENYITLDDYMMMDLDASSHFRGRGEGTESSPYEVENEMDMAFIRYEPEACYKLNSDIVLDDYSNYEDIYGWNLDYDFSGVFDGNNKTISNLIIHSSDPIHDNYGLFYSNSGTIKNLLIDNFDIYIYANELVTDSIVKVGAICGLNTGTIDYITVNNSEIIVNNLMSHSGGICGENFGEIKNTSVNYTPITGSGYIGGIAGYAESVANHTSMYNSSYNNGSINLVLFNGISSIMSVGGLAGGGDFTKTITGQSPFVLCSINDSIIQYTPDGDETIDKIGIYVGFFVARVLSPVNSSYFEGCSYNISDAGTAILKIYGGFNFIIGSGL
ncbi:hypothetical protein RJI07_02665 [Mycoplasmatota bacterium WC30]